LPFARVKENPVKKRLSFWQVRFGITVILAGRLSFWQLRKNHVILADDAKTHLSFWQVIFAQPRRAAGWFPLPVS
jgi:hypothetical protein